METFSENQLSAINSNHSNIVVVASPGSGKTRTLVARVQRLIKDGVKPSSIVVITFTNVAADEINARLGIVLGYCGTLHGFMLRLLQNYGRMVGFSGPLTVLDEEDAMTFKKETIARLNYKGSMEAFNAALLSPVDKAKSMNVTQIAAAGYHRALVRANMVDFDSILVFGYNLLTCLPSLSFLHLLVDEYQDSGDWDDRIYSKLLIPNKFFVGDPDQSIYGFRGGNIQHILDRSHASNFISLQENYRSDKLICECAQLLIEHNKNRIDKKTIPVSPNNGEVDYWFNIPNPGREAQAIAEDVTNRNNADDCAVLVRTNYQLTQVRDLLESFGVKCRKPEFVSGGFPFWKNARVFVSLLANPNNDFVARQWLNMVMPTKEANRIALVAAARKESINSFHLKLPREVKLERIPALMVEAKIFEATVSEVGKLIDKMPGVGIAELSVAMTAEPKSNSFAPVEQSGVVISTMHGAKGREFGTVYLPAFEQEIIPSKKKDIDVEEERRLAYVAFTRAKHRLVVCVCRERQQSEWQVKPHPSTPSQFITEAQIS